MSKFNPYAKALAHGLFQPKKKMKNKKKQLNRQIIKKMLKKQLEY